ERVKATLAGHRAPVWAIAFGPQGKLLATASDDGQVKLWDPATAKEVRTVRYPENEEKGSFRAVAFSPDGKRLVTGTRDGRVTVWDTDTGKPIFTTDKGHAGVVVSVAFSPDGKMIASGSGDKTVKLWDADTGLPQQTLEGQLGGIYSVAFA